MRKSRFVLIALAMSLLPVVIYRQLTAPRTAQAQRRQIEATKFSPDRFEPQTVLSPQPAIIRPKHVSLAEGDGELRSNELVLGVVVNGQARAYPINMLTGPSREIFNDKLGGRDIAATW